MWVVHGQSGDEVPCCVLAVNETFWVSGQESHPESITIFLGILDLIFVEFLLEDSLGPVVRGVQDIRDLHHVL